MIASLAYFHQRTGSGRTPAAPRSALRPGPPHLPARGPRGPAEAGGGGGLHQLDGGQAPAASELRGVAGGQAGTGNEGIQRCRAHSPATAERREAGVCVAAVGEPAPKSPPAPDESLWRSDAPQAHGASLWPPCSACTPLRDEAERGRGVGLCFRFGLEEGLVQMSNDGAF